MNSQIPTRHGLHCINCNQNVLNCFLLSVAAVGILNLMFAGCSSSDSPYPTTSVPRTLDSRGDGSWAEATLELTLGDCEWEDKGKYFVLRSKVTISNASRKNVYLLKEDISEPDYAIEPVDDKHDVLAIFSGTRPAREFTSSSLMRLVPDEKIVIPIEWECFPRRNDSGLSFRVDDYIVAARSDVRLRYWVRSMVWLVVIDAVDDSKYVDMWALADNPKNSFQTDSWSEWVTVTFPENEPAALNNQGE